MKKVLILFASPRKNGNTHFVTVSVIKGIEYEASIEWIFVSDLKISPCSACNGCEPSGICIIEDAMTEIYKKTNEADIVIVASPLYFNSVSAQLKILIDRYQAIYAGKQNSKILIDKPRKGYFICTAGSPKANFTGAKMVMELFFKTMNANYSGDLLIADTDKVVAQENKNIDYISFLK